MVFKKAGWFQQSMQAGTLALHVKSIGTLVSHAMCIQHLQASHDLSQVQMDKKLTLLGA